MHAGGSLAALLVASCVPCIVLITGGPSFALEKWAQVFPTPGLALELLGLAEFQPQPHCIA